MATTIQSVMRCTRALILIACLILAGRAVAEPAKAPHFDINGDPLPDGAVARLGTTRHQFPENIRATALSPDGKTVAGVTDHRKGGADLYFLDTATGKIVRKLEAIDIDCEVMQYTPDGKGLAFNNGGGVTVVDLETGRVASSVAIETSRYCAIALSTDGKWVAAQPDKCVYDAPVGIWETKTGKEVVSLPGKGASCKGLAFSPDGKRLLLRSLVPTEVDADRLRFEGSKVALACIDIDARKIVGETQVETSEAVALSPDGETVALEAADHKSVSIRHLPTGTERCVLAVNEPRFAFAPDGKMLFTIDENGRGTLWDAANGEKIRDLEGALGSRVFSKIGISRDGRTIAILDSNWYGGPMVVVWNAATGKRVGQPVGHESAITCIAYMPGGKFLASGSDDKTVRLWDAATGEHLRILTVLDEWITAIAISPDGKLLASSSYSGVLRLSSIANGKTVAEFAGQSGGGADVLAFSEESTVLFVGSHSPTVVAWEFAGAKGKLRFNTGEHGTVMAFANGGELALTANGRHLRICNPVNKLPSASIAMPEEHSGSVVCHAAIFSRDGRLVASSQISQYGGVHPSYDAPQLRLWERISGQAIRTLAPAVTTVLAFSPDGRFLAAGAAGKSGHHNGGYYSGVPYGSGIDIWDTISGDSAGSLPTTPQCIAFSPDGRFLATGARDHSVLIWKVPKPNFSVTGTAPSSTMRDGWWPALGGDAKGAYKAMGQMIDFPEQTVALLKEKVRPAEASDPETVAKLIVQLDSVTYADRADAQKTLEKMGDGAADLILNALDGKVSVEARRRLEDLLNKCDEISPPSMQHHRAVATLEWIDTPAARALLRGLADGAPRARLTIEARAALKRHSS